LADRIEAADFILTTKEEKLKIFENLCENEQLNVFMKNKFPTSKRFGIEGCDTAILSLKSLVESAGDDGMNHLVFGMAHRGRLNTLGLVFQKSLAEIFAEIKETKSNLTSFDEKTWGGSGDVKVNYV
jgi:2-oxoglutarate dehydrogenase E1 component